MGLADHSNTIMLLRPVATCDGCNIHRPSSQLPERMMIMKAPDQLGFPGQTTYTQFEAEDKEELKRTLEREGWKFITGKLNLERNWIANLAYCPQCAREISEHL